MSKKNKKKQKQKQKKEKIVYYDDNSTIADMSQVTDVKGRKKRQTNDKQQSTAKEKWATFFTAMKKMVLPCAIVLTVLLAVYIILLLITGQMCK